MTLRYNSAVLTGRPMIEDIIRSAREQTSDRLASPLLGSFLVSWCLWNYKFLVILFSDASVTMTFRLIKEVAFPDPSVVVLNGVLLPLATAVAYIFVYPYPARLVYGFTRRRQREINDLRREIEGETPLTLQESRQLRAEVIESEFKHQEELDRLNNEIARLREELDRIRAPGKPALQASELVLSPSQLKLMKVLERVGGKALHSHLVTGNGPTRVGIEYDLGELKRLNLIHVDYDQSEGENSYELTHDGRRVVLSGVSHGGEPVSA